METLREYIRSGKHRVHRRQHHALEALAQQYAAEGLCAEERMTRRFELLCALEEPVLLPGEKICFLRTVTTVPDIFTPEEWAAIRKDHFIHELGYNSNLSPNYARVIATGLEALREVADAYGKRIIDAILSLADRYRQAAQKAGNEELAAVLAQVPRKGAKTFYQALQFFRILHFSLWLEGNYHNTTGRFDQYMWPYLKQDLASGLLDEAGALALVEDFFLSFNKDSDLYPGVQQGDNGQSMVLGGKDGINLLSKLCLQASAANRMIDPKLNLRVSRDTPTEVFELGTELTRIGLGFPQYSNDDAVIPALVDMGYAPEDAQNYVVAACWEFIIPGVGRDVANIGALSLPKVIDRCLHRDLAHAQSFEEFMSAVAAELQMQCDDICGGVQNLWFVPSPFLSLLMDEDKYHNFGIHGTGIATAADSLAAIKRYVFEEKLFTPRQLVEAVDRDFAEDAPLLHTLRCETPKLGMDDPLPAALAQQLLGLFSAALEGRRNCLGGIFRAGTGSAMYYLWHAEELGAGPDGRRKGEPFGANFSPSLFAAVPGPLSVIRTFAGLDLRRCMNGGPLTLEFSQTVFRTRDSIRKVAELVRLFILLGGHQLQLNTVDAEALRAAQQDPDSHRQLVVRIWGWSAYFVELETQYQEHVLRRQQYGW